MSQIENTTGVSNPATAALLQAQLEQQKEATRLRPVDSKNVALPHVAQWASLFDDGVATRSHDLPSTVTSSISCATKKISADNVGDAGDESESSYDSSDSDESINVSEDEEETRVAQALVRASYNGLSSAAINRLLGSSSALKRKDRNTSMPDINITPRIDLIRQEENESGPPVKKSCVTIHETRNSIHRISSDWSARANLQPSACRPIPISRSSVLLTPGMLGNGATFTKRTLNGSESSPALRLVGTVSANGSGVSSLLRSSSGAVSHDTATTPAVRAYVKPDEKLKTILSEAKLKEPQQIPFSSLPNFFTEITPEAVAAYDIPVVQALRTENIEELRKMKAANKPMLCGNKFGETTLHAAARRRSAKVVQFLLQECNVTPRVCCDSGRTPLHDACWTVDTNFDVVDLLLDACPDLLYITDKRGFTPMSYVREELWAQWCAYLDKRGAHKLVANELF